MDDPREELLRVLRAREGLVRLGRLTIEEANDSLRRSLPRVQDAIRLFDRVEERLGERGARDTWANDRERCLLVRDAERPDWFLPQRLLYLEIDLRKPPPATGEPIELPDWLKGLATPAEPEPDAGEPVVLGPAGRSGRLRIEEGPANLEIKYDEGGAWEETTLTVGDEYFFAERADTESFHLDPHARPPQVPPVSMLTRDDLRPEGHRVDELVEHVLELRREAANRGRVYVPVAQPGGVTGAWRRGLANLRVAGWEGRVPDEDGWVVVDAWNGTAIATGPSFEGALKAWRAVVARVQPLPPVERRRDEAPENLGPEPDRAKFDEETKTAVFGFRIAFELHPPVQLDWPEPRAEHVPAIALPISRAPAIRTRSPGRGSGAWCGCSASTGRPRSGSSATSPTGSC